MQITEIERVTSSFPSDYGCTRNVWFFGDTVIKVCKYGNANIREYANFVENDGEIHGFEFNGDDWVVALPKTSMVGKYLIMEYISSPHGWANKDCPYCVNEDGSRDGASYDMHINECVQMIHIKVDLVANRLGLKDMHLDNYRVDWENKIVWLIDFAS